MTDDVKAADAALVESMVRQLRDCVSVGDEMTLDHASLIDDAEDWIAGEAARTAAAVAAAREEQREACALNFPKPAGESLADPWASALVRATPLTATPLADELRDEREVSQSLREQLIAAEAERDEAQRGEQEAWRQTDQMRTERDAMKKTLAAELESSQALRGDVVSLTAQVDALMPLENERDALRAQTSLTDGPCVECGESTQWAAGDPGRWSVMLPTEAEPGVAKHHHVKCVLGWRAQVEAARAACARFDRGGGLMWPGEVLAAMDGAKP